jgi:hypothetical protein
MTIEEVTYMEVLGDEYPNVKVQALGDGSDYEMLHWTGGDPLPSKEELDSDRLYSTRVRVWSVIKAKRDQLQQSGVKVGTHWYHSDLSSRIQQLALVMFGANLPTSIMWKTLDGAFVLMTPLLASQIFQSSAASDIAIFTAAETHKARMMASAAPHLYDFSAGWPASYTGNLLL